ncbi:CO dehydrogenase/acetyl-CoA synthase complex subunit epsilon [Candidatus Pyrohabitans sp.]
MRATSWRLSMEAGPTKAKPVSAEVAARIIKNASRPALVIGARITEHERLIEFVERLGRARIAIVATAHAIRYTSQRGIPAHKVGVVEATNLLTDPDWEGFDGKGKPDLLMLFAINLDLENQTCQTLKNFSDVKTLSIDRYFLVNATYSFPNLDESTWLSYLEELCQKLGV